MKVKKVLLVALGCVGLALGAVGAVVPLLPAFPFLMLAAFCFAKSSERLHTWFTGTKLYKKNLESYVSGVMVTVTVLMSIGFVMMHQVRVGQVVLACVWVFHILYFCFGVKTRRVPAEA